MTAGTLPAGAGTRMTHAQKEQMEWNNFMRRPTRAT